MKPLQTAAPPAADMRRIRARVYGTVQGVGFRPFVFRLADGLGLAGFVLNDERGVVVEAEGTAAAIDRFLQRLPTEAPPLARVEGVDAGDTPPTGEPGFRIVDSHRGGRADALVAPDAATCADCLAELFDPADRRHRYPFTNCTNCGPRLTIVRGVPYDRPLTTMAGFEMCPACRAEYDDPRDRRFHAQPNACPECGPRVSLADHRGLPVIGHAADRDPIETAARHLGAGSILAIKGIGGFHIACVAADARAVTALRARKHREEKPFAIMAPDLATARGLVELTTAEQALLESPQRPIVIARRRAGAAVAPAVAPCSPDLGVMLPYSPLHHLLLTDAEVPLVMTSGNVSDEPIAFDDADGLERLAGIADLFLLHDRPIHTRTDDSVLRSLTPKLRAAPLLIRRSRGYVPRSIDLPVRAARPVLACGAELKNTFCVARENRAWVGHHIGDLKNFETLGSFRAGIEHFERLFAVQPAIVAHDLHPDYLSTRYALERDGVEHLPVQHHHAHLAACLAENGIREDAVGAIYDGAGLGPDGTIWGGELLVGGIGGYERAGCLHPVRQPGGDAATREPWRMACAWIAAAYGEERPATPPALRGAVGEEEWSGVCELIRTGVASPLTTSAGRLFDAVAALCGLRAEVEYEGQAAVELEAICAHGPADPYPMPLLDGGAEHEPGVAVLDARATIRAVAADLGRGADPALVSARFHDGLALASAGACEREAERRGLGRVVLSGGVFQNRRLLERTALELTDRGLEVLIPELLPPNDGGISFGQVAIAAAHLSGMETA